MDTPWILTNTDEQKYFQIKTHVGGHHAIIFERRGRQLTNTRLTSKHVRLTTMMSLYLLCRNATREETTACNVQQTSQTPAMFPGSIRYAVGIVASFVKTHNTTLIEVLPMRS
ncbi:unnamed protein product [Ectocarpus sp. 13 AM-2016]